MLEGSIAAARDASTCWGCAPATAAPATSSPRSRSQAARKEDVLKALSQIAKTFRTRVGESLATVEKHSTPLEEATTASLEALKAYSAALKLNGTGDYAAALPLFKRAAELDPQFAMAFANMGTRYSGLGEATLSAESTHEGVRTAPSGQRSGTLLHLRELRSPGDRQPRKRSCRRSRCGRKPIPAITSCMGYCRDSPRTELDGTSCASRKRRNRSRSIRMSSFPTSTWSTCNLYLERIDQAERAWQRAATLNSTFQDVPLFGYYLAFLKADRAGMDRQAAVARTRPGGEESDQPHRGARPRAGRPARGRGDAGAPRRRRGRAGGAREGVALYEAAPAVWNAFFGDATAARQHAAAALQLIARPRRSIRGRRGAGAGGRHDPGAAARGRPREALSRGHVGAIELLADAARAVLASRRPAVAGHRTVATGASLRVRQPCHQLPGVLRSLYPVYVRGEAYLAAHKGAEAAAEFQKILDHRGLVLADPMAARARLELGRAWALAGDAAKASAAYAGFPHALEGRGPRHPDSQASEGRIRQAAVSFAFGCP